MDESIELLDDEEKLVLTVALTVLGILALGALVLILCDSALFKEDDDDDDDEYYTNPSWALKQVQLYQAKLAEELRQAPVQQQQYTYAQPSPEVLTPPPPPPPPRQPSPPPISPPPRRASPPLLPSKQVFSQGTQTPPPPIMVTRETQTDFEQAPLQNIQPEVREQKPPKQSSFRDPESQQLLQVGKPAAATPANRRLLGQSTSPQQSSVCESAVSVQEDQLIVASDKQQQLTLVYSPQQQLTTPDDPDESVEVVPDDEPDDENDELNPENQLLSTNDMITINEAQPPSALETGGAETVSERSQGDTDSEEDDRTQSNRSRESIVSISSYTPRESGSFSLPEEVRNFATSMEVESLPPTADAESTPQVLFPDTPLVSPPEAVSPDAQIKHLKTLIPRYSWKVERQRFIILNGLILIITGCIVGVLIINFYI